MQQAYEALDLDELILMPCRRSPHKAINPGASDDQRLAMLMLATEHLPWVQVSDYELKQPPPSYTWETLKVFSQQFPEETRWFVLIGLDQWLSLDRWKHPERIGALAEFIVLGRDGDPVTRPRYRSHLLSADHPASSSAIRRALSRSMPPQIPLNEWLPPSVLTFIDDHQLYRTPPSFTEPT